MSKIKSKQQSVTDFPKLASPARRALASADFTKLEQLTKVTEAELSQLHGIGPKALEQLRLALSAKRMSFAKKKRE